MKNKLKIEVDSHIFYINLKNKTLETVEGGIIELNDNELNYLLKNIEEKK